jgi:hypothetical protein
LIDHTNRHLFQPRLFQVATSVIPGRIVSSIRGIPSRPNPVLEKKEKVIAIIAGSVSV